MRNILAERIERVFDNDAGVAAVIVAISLLVLLGAAMISIDAGSVWTTRREAVTSTDAAALGAARFFASKPSAACDAGQQAGVESEATSLLVANRPGSELTALEVDPKDCLVGAGTVEVSSTGKAPLHFAPVFNINSADVESSSTAQWGPITEIRGLRRLAFCIEDPHVLEWITLSGTPSYQLLDGTPGHPGDSEYPGAGVVHRIDDSEAFDCDAEDEVKSSWAWLDLGQNDPVSLGENGSGDEDCELGGSADDCVGRIGSKARNIRSQLRRDICEEDTPTD
ncbi:MAG: pilus assembly protein TadG-related protein, partial [Acidimicrobiia bacterium]